MVFYEYSTNDIMIILIVLLLAVAIFCFWVKKNSHNNEKVLVLAKKVESNNSNNPSASSSYKDDYVDLTDIVPITGQRADGPMDTYTTFIAGIGKYCNQRDVGYIIGRVMPESVTRGQVHNTYSVGVRQSSSLFPH